MATNQPQDDFQKTALRLPRELHARVHAAAAATGRSYNAEIVDRLGESFEVKAIIDRLSNELALRDAARKVLTTRIAEMELEIRSVREKYLKKSQELADLANQWVAWIPGKVRDQIEEAAKEVGRPVWAEMAARLERSFEEPPLVPLLARLEQDLASMDVEKTAEQLRVWMLASTLQPLLAMFSEDVVLEGPLENTTVKDWRGLVEAMIGQTRGAYEGFSAAQVRFDAAKAKVKSLLPTEATFHGGGLVLEPSGPLYFTWPPDESAERVKAAQALPNHPAATQSSKGPVKKQQTGLGETFDEFFQRAVEMAAPPTLSPQPVSHKDLLDMLQRLEWFMQAPATSDSQKKQLRALRSKLENMAKP